MPKLAIYNENRETISTFVNVIPNPAKNKITVQFVSEIKGMFKIEIYDILGNIIKSKDFSKQQNSLEFEIETTIFPNGIYYFRILQSGELIINDKFTIQK